MVFLTAGPDITPITNLITTWIHIGQALVGSIGASAFILALLCTSITLLPRRGLSPRQWAFGGEGPGVRIHIAVARSAAVARIDPHTTFTTVRCTEPSASSF